MGFSYKFYALDKDKFNSLKDLNLEQLSNLYPCQDYESTLIPFELLDVFNDCDNLADLILDKDYIEKILNSSKPMFKNSEVWESIIKYSEREGDIPYEVPKEVLLYVIEQAKKNLIDYFKDIKECPARTQLYLERKIDNWTETNYGMIPFNLDLNKKEIVNSYSDEYYIFELVRIYKDFDETKQALIIYGW